jgi:8-oxo-dGTP pyrophosphatase MutT (NUDIX family)
MRKPSFYNSKCYGGIIKSSSSGKYLLVKGIDKWSFPKGHREKDETPFDCAKREIYEETGLTINDIKNKKAVFVSVYYYFDIVLDNECPTNPIDTNEVKDIRWFLPEETKEIEKNKDVNVFFSNLLNNKRKINNDKKICVMSESHKEKLLNNNKRKIIEDLDNEKKICITSESHKEKLINNDKCKIDEDLDNDKKIRVTFETHKPSSCIQYETGTLDTNQLTSSFNKYFVFITVVGLGISFLRWVRR